MHYSQRRLGTPSAAHVLHPRLEGIDVIEIRLRQGGTRRVRVNLANWLLDSPWPRVMK